MKQKLKKLWNFSIEIPLVPILCFILLYGVLSSGIYYAFTDGRRMMYARHIPKEKEPLEIAYVFDKPDEIVYYSNPFFGKKMEEWQLDEIWEVFCERIAYPHSSAHKLGELKGKELLEHFKGLHCMEFRYEQRRKSVDDLAFEGATFSAFHNVDEYDGMMLFLTEDLGFHSIVFYKDLKRETIYRTLYDLGAIDDGPFSERMKFIIRWS